MTIMLDRRAATVWLIEYTYRTRTGVLCTGQIATKSGDTENDAIRRLSDDLRAPFSVKRIERLR
jgi:hypothetical protein